jgi:hypothetical protein
MRLWIASLRTAMTEDTNSAFPRRVTPELCINVRLRKTERAGNAGCFSAPADGVTGLEPSKPAALATALFDGARHAISRDLATGQGYQDHTPSPSAAKAFVGATARAAHAASTASRAPRVVTIAIRPFIEAGRRYDNHNFP